jgi:hypothetical protein
MVPANSTKELALPCTCHKSNLLKFQSREQEQGNFGIPHRLRRLLAYEHAHSPQPKQQVQVIQVLGEGERPASAFWTRGRIGEKTPFK